MKIMFIPSLQLVDYFKVGEEPIFGANYLSKINFTIIIYYLRMILLSGYTIDCT